MNRFYFICLLIVMAAVEGNAQILKPGFVSKRGDTGKIYLRWNPAGLIDFNDGNVTLGCELRLNQTWAGTFDAGYIFYSEYYSKAKMVKGILLRPGIRMYMGKYHDLFLDLQFHYKKVTYHIDDWLGKKMVEDVATYEEYKRFRARKEVTGGQLMFGVREYFSRKGRRLFVEVALGVGVREKRERLVDEPNSGYRPRTGLSSTTNSEGVIKTVPALPGVVRLVYKIF